MRTAARETTFKIVFASQFTEPEHGLSRALFKTENLTENDEKYCNGVLKIIGEHGKELEELLDSHSRLFPASGLFPADKSILLVALAEILYMEEIPSAVSVNEAANIASKYSSAKSASFVSGILAEIIRERENV